MATRIIDGLFAGQDGVGGILDPEQWHNDHVRHDAWEPRPSLFPETAGFACTASLTAFQSCSRLFEPPAPFDIEFERFTDFEAQNLLGKPIF